MSILIAVHAGCASPLPPPAAYGHVVGEPVDVLSGKPNVVADSEPTTFVGITAEQREAFEKERLSSNAAREQRIANRTRSQMSGQNSIGGMAVECAVRTLVVLSPLCLLIVPTAYGVGTAVEGRIGAVKESYLPGLPSDQELARIQGRIQELVSSEGVASQLAGKLRPDQPPAEGAFPRLWIRIDSVSFGVDRLITIKVMARVEPVAGAAWPPTEHRYYLGYGEGAGDLDKALEEARANIAASIASTYMRVRSADPTQSGAPLAGPLSPERDCSDLTTRGQQRAPPGSTMRDMAGTSYRCADGIWVAQ